MLSYKTLLGCLIFVVLWSSGWIGSKYGQLYAGTFTLLAYRYAIVVLALLVFVFVTKSWRSIPRRQLIFHICVGVLSHAIFLGAGNSALDLGVSAGLVALITALQPMITATLSPAIAGESVSFRQWSGLALGFAAILLVVSDKIAMGAAFFAYSLPFAAVFAISVASLIDRKISTETQADDSQPAPLSLIALIHSVGALLVFSISAATLEGFNAQWGIELIFSIVWLAFVVSLGAYGMMFFMLRKISAIKVASLVYLSPPATMLIAFIVFGERLTNIDLAGLVFAGIAVWLVLSKPSASSTDGYLNSANDPVAGSLVLEPQGLLASKLYLDRAIHSKSLDIDLGEPIVTTFDYLGGHAQIAARASRESQQEIIKYEELLYFRKHQINRLNQVLINLKDCEGQIDELRMRVPEAAMAIPDSVMDDIDLKHACSSLENLVTKQTMKNLQKKQGARDSTNQAASYLANRQKIPGWR